ncbi:hypothetical protein J2S78_002858 [Salibacterium salarium]|uniref:hypothetical protein n=1 Tax=Salibacterium salarium TaxID=284579 RepID=UPI0027822D88|nr:hypothetical protein [Salibacterium salarium]MDQ0300411.1 hypothetical protein [Salibacterium salarium]
MEVNVYVRVNHSNYKVHNPRNIGNVLVVWEYKGRTKETYFTSLETTHNRSILLASVIALEQLKKPCTVNLYVQTAIGEKFLYNAKKWTNRDLGDKLTLAKINGGHVLNIVDCSWTEKGKDLMNKLAQKLKRSIKMYSH